MFDKIVGNIGNFSYRNRKIISILAIILFISVIILESQAIIEYSYAEESLVTDIFPQDDTLVIVYDNKDEDKINQIISYLEKDEHVTSIQAYGNTLGAEMSPSDISSMMGIPEVFVNTLFYMYMHGTDASSMTLVQLTSFLSSDDFLNNEMFSSMIDEGSKAQIQQMKSLVDALDSEKEYSAEEISEMLGVDAELVQSIFYIAQMKNLNIFNITPMFWATVADAWGMEAETIERIFRVKPVKSLKFDEFVDIMYQISVVAQGLMDEEQAEQLGMLHTMSTMVNEKTPLTPKDVETLFSFAGENSMLNEGTVTLLYVMASGNTTGMSEVKIPLYDFFTFILEDILHDDAFSSFLDENAAAQLEDAKVMMDEGIAQLVGDNYSRMVVTIDYPMESDGMYSFYSNLDLVLKNTFSGEYYLVGASAMSYEVSGTFEKEYLLISIVTAIAVFAVVWFTFKNFTVSLLLIAVIECAMYSMMSVMAVTNSPIYFVALILVQCILMGSMIDYGILFTTYYMETRKEYSIEKALPETMKRATHAILTSSLVIIFVTLVCSVFMTGAVATILKTLGIGSLCAILLILFALPALLVIFDKRFVHEKAENVKINEIEE